MSTLPHLLRSLLITSILSFLMPVLFLSGLLGCSAVLGYVPHMSEIGHTSLVQMTHFLEIFGSGSVWRGLTIIGLAGSLVGILFDTYIFYRCQNWRNHHN